MPGFSPLRRWFMGHAREALASSKSPVPWPHMIITATAAAVPTVAGLVHGELQFAIYGALAGYLMALNDHFGELRHRLLICTITFLAFIASFQLGVSLQEWMLGFVMMLGLLTYWLGLMGGTGAEVERLLLFSIIVLVVIHYAPTMAGDVGGKVLPYGLLALVTIYIGQIWSDRFARLYRNDSFARLRPSLKESLTLTGARHRYAVNYLVASLLSVGLVERYQIERGYWMIVTVLLVMRPNFRESLYRHVQRLVGTVLGVFVGDLLILLIDIKALLLLGVFAAAFGVPYAMKRNYWMVSFFATIMVVLFLTLPTTGPTGWHVPFVRLKATAYGCALSGAVTLVSALLTALLKPRGGADHA